MVPQQDAVADAATVLVVDDEPEICRLVAATLESHRPQDRVITAGSAADALAALKQGGIDAIIADYRMPGMDGLEFLKEAAASEPNVPRIMLTAYPDLDLALRALKEAHILNFLTKPVDAEKLVAIVTEAVGMHRGQAQQA